MNTEQMEVALNDLDGGLRPKVWHFEEKHSTLETQRAQKAFLSHRRIVSSLAIPTL